MEPKDLITTGGIIIGCLTWLGVFWQENKKKAAQARHDSYVQFIAGVAKVKFAVTEQERSAALTSVADAKARILLYGGSGVLDALDDFCRTSQNLADRAACEAFCRLLQAMQLDAANRQSSLGLVGRVALGIDPDEAPAAGA